VPELSRRTLEKEIDRNPVVEARAFFERLTPLESFQNIDSRTYVDSLRSTSQILRSRADQRPQKKKTLQFVKKFLELLELKTIVLISPIVVAEIYAGAF
jgi:hypothetical protein